MGFYKASKIVTEQGQGKDFQQGRPVYGLSVRRLLRYFLVTSKA
jgi:hypothetical protein